MVVPLEYSIHINRGQSLIIFQKKGLIVFLRNLDKHQ